MQSMVERDPSMRDFYDDYNERDVSRAEMEAHKKYLESLSDAEMGMLDKGGYYYQLDFTNVGGMVMPLVIEFKFEDGSSEIKRIPAQIWSRNNKEVSKVFWFDKRVKGVRLDPNLETADCNTGNNSWPPSMEKNRFELYKRSYGGAAPNPMQRKQP